jgi:site-specific recombinase
MFKFPNLLQRSKSVSDLSALLSAANVQARMVERHLWWVCLLEWLRHADLPNHKTATPMLRLQYLLEFLSEQPQHQTQVRAMAALFWREVDVAALLADFGFSPRMDLMGELGQRLRLHLIPVTPDTTDLAELFNLLFPLVSDAHWLSALDEKLLNGLVNLLNAPGETGLDWRAPFLDAVMFLSSSIRAVGFSPLLRSRMNPELLVHSPFQELTRVAQDMREHLQSGNPAVFMPTVQRFKALLQMCRSCAESVHEHLEDHGVSVDLVFELDQLRLRTRR